MLYDILWWVTAIWAGFVQLHSNTGAQNFFLHALRPLNVPFNLSVLVSSAKEERVSSTVCLCKGAALEEIYGHCFSWIVKGDLLGTLKEGTNGKTIKVDFQHMWYVVIP